MAQDGAKGRKPRPAKTPIEQINGESKFARALGSVDYHTREAGLQALAAWLGRRQDIEELELLKLWKGIFYCFWHSDKTAVQTALAERLSEIMTQLPEQVGWDYFRIFVRTMRREWAGIDRLRLDKFMMLVRKLFAALLRSLQAHAWNERRTRRAADFWLQEVLLPCDTLAAAGVAYHWTDLLLPELGGCVGVGGGAPPDNATLRLLLEPYCAALADTPNPALIYRLRQGVFDPLLSEVRQAGEAAPLRHLDVAALAAHLFDLGARAETRARNREALYAISSALEKAAAKQQRGQGQQPEASAEQPQQQAKRRQREQQAAAAEQQQEQQEQGAPPPTSSKKSKKRRQAEEAAVAAAATPLQEQRQQEAQAQASAPPPSSSKKARKSRLAPAEAAQLQAAARQQQHQHDDGEQRGRRQQPASHDISAREQELLAAAVAAVTGAGGAAAEAAGGTPGGSPSKKKNVRFSLKRNLVNVIGQPPKPVEVRTPPTSKPKGPALKRESAFGGPASAPERLLTRAGVSRMAHFQSYMNGKAAPGSATKAEEAAAAAAAGKGSAGSGKKQKRRASMPAPGSFSRPRASEFF